MNTRILKTRVICLLAAAVAALPLHLAAQNTNKPVAEKKSVAAKKAPAEKKKSAHPYRGKLIAVDKNGKFIKLGKSTYYITADTKITRDGAPATLADAVLQEQVTGYAKPDEQDRMVAASLKLGGKGESKTVEKKKKSK